MHLSDKIFCNKEINMYLCAVNNTKPIIMSRQERQQSATGIYHVMLRGINKQWIMSARLCRFALQRTAFYGKFQTNYAI
jgi:hypothetical protein